MPNLGGYEYLCTVDGNNHQAWFFLGAPKQEPNQLPSTEFKVGVDRHWVFYYVDGQTMSALQAGATPDLFKNWYNEGKLNVEKLAVLLIRDVVKVLLRGRKSFFKPTSETDSYNVAMDELTYAVAQPEDEAVSIVPVHPES